MNDFGEFHIPSKKIEYKPSVRKINTNIFYRVGAGMPIIGAVAVAAIGLGIYAADFLGKLQDKESSKNTITQVETNNSLYNTIMNATSIHNTTPETEDRPDTIPASTIEKTFASVAKHTDNTMKNGPGYSTHTMAINGQAFKKIHSIEEYLNHEINTSNKYIASQISDGKVSTDMFTSRLLRSEGSSHNPTLFEKYITTRNLDYLLIDDKTYGTWVKDFKTAVHEVADFYKQGIQKGLSHSKSLQYAARNASAAVIQNKSDAYEALKIAQNQGNNAKFARWDASRHDIDKVRSDIQSLRSKGMSWSAIQKNISNKECTAISIRTIRNIASS
jgi:hypothetical protein